MNIKDFIFFNRLARLFLITMIVFPALSQANDLDALAETTFLEDEKIAYEIEQLESLGWEAGAFHIVHVSSLCGVAGCDSTILVLYLFSLKDGTPHSKSVMATVQIRQPGYIIVAVTRVSLEAVRTITLQSLPGGSRAAIQTAPHPGLKIEGLKKPVKSPQLRVIDKRLPK